MINGNTHEVTVKKVEPNTITYNFKGEALENVVNKLIFKNGLDQLFTTNDTPSIDKNFEYPPLDRDLGAILPFALIFEGEMTKDQRIITQEYYYSEVMRKPERNTITYQNPETTKWLLRAAGIADSKQYQDYDILETGKLLGVGIIP